MDEEAIGPSRSPKRTVSCFGKGEPFYLITLIQVSTILSGAQSVRQPVTWIGLCSRSGLTIRSGTASTCWVFTVTSIVLILILAWTRKRREERETPSKILVMDITEEIIEEVTMSGNIKITENKTGND